MTWLEVLAVLLLAFIATVEIYDVISKSEESIRETWRLSNATGPLIRNGQRILCNLCSKNAIYFDYHYHILFYQRHVELDIESLCEDHAP